MAVQTGFWANALPVGITAAAGTELAGDMLEQGETSAENLRTMAGDAATATAFNPYSVKSALGDVNVDATGSTSGLIGGGDVGMGDYRAGMDNMDAASIAAMEGTSNPAYAQSLGMMGQSGDMAMANAGNPAYQQAMGGMASGMQGLGGAQAGALSASQQAMANSMQDTGGREQDIYARMMAMQQPGMDRATASMEARAQAQGRGGISGSQYGGSGEQFANSRAQAEARNTASFGAMNQAQQEMMNQGQLAGQYGQLGQDYAGAQGSLAANMGQLGQGQASLGQSAAQIFGQQGQNIGALGSDQARLGQSGAGLMAQIGGQQAGLGLDAYSKSFMPADMQLRQAGLGLSNADMAQTGQITGANLGAQLGLGAEQISVNANKAASELYGNMFGSMASPLGAIGSQLDQEGIKGIWDSITGIFGE